MLRRSPLTEAAAPSLERGTPPGANGGEARAATVAAVLFATIPAADGGPAAALPLLGTTPIGRLLDQLESLGVSRVWVLTRPEWKAAVEAAAAASEGATVVTTDDAREDLRVTAEIADQIRGPLLVGNAHVVTHREALAGLLADSRIASGALATGAASQAAWSFPIRSEGGRVVSAASEYHRVSRANGAFLGLLKVDPRDRERVVAAAQGLGGIPVEDGVSLLVVGLVRTGVDLSPCDLRGFFQAAPLSADAARAVGEELSRSDEERALLESAVKSNDGFFTTFFVSPYSKYLARFAARRGVTPDSITILSFGIGIAAAAAFAFGSRASLIAGALLLQLSFTVDCVDGQVARYTRTFSRLGAWLDSVFDRTKEYLVYGGLAIGSTQGFDDDVWILAAAALALQTVRHFSDFAYVASLRPARAPTPPLPLDRPDDALPQASFAGASELRALGPLRAPRLLSLAQWGNRFVRLPIGERFALISLTAALWNPRVTFIALLAWGGFAAAYALALRILVSYGVVQRMVRPVRA
jgi:phosphatidylglycerophosphate synthase